MSLKFDIKNIVSAKCNPIFNVTSKNIPFVITLIIFYKTNSTNFTIHKIVIILIKIREQSTVRQTKSLTFLPITKEL